MSELGEIRNREHATQLRVFKGLQYGNMLATDIDGFADIRGRLFMFFETKHNGAALPFGQRLAFERLCDAIQRGGSDCIYFIASHYNSGDIECADAIVTEYRWKGQWRKAEGHRKLSEYWFDAIEAHGCSL